jgi:hypothetical protein
MMVRHGFETTGDKVGSVENEATPAHAGLRANFHTEIFLDIVHCWVLQERETEKCMCGLFCPLERPCKRETVSPAGERVLGLVVV